jgi:hypothetical protein
MPQPMKNECIPRRLTTCPELLFRLSIQSAYSLFITRLLPPSRLVLPVFDKRGDLRLK